MKKIVRNLSVVVTASIGFLSMSGFSTHQPLGEAHPPIHIKDNATSTYQNGIKPSQLRTAYGVGKLTATGKGQTIAIVDAYGSPTIANDLQTFNNQFGVTGTGTLSVVYPNGQPSKTDGGWALETAMDVEWAHAIAPDANIMLVVAKSASISDLIAAEDYATAHGAVVVSNSWGGSEFSSEASYDTHFNHTGVVYVASSGDNGSGVSFPASSPYVLSVGGTNLKIDSAGNYQSETGWTGSGGGKSTYEARPSYEDSVVSVVGTQRGNPDVAWDADPNTGVAVYSSTRDQGQQGWFQVGGTSLGSPCWAALIALADEGRATPLTSYNTISTLYSTTSGDYHDITSGSNGGFTAQTGFDLVTGVGSPMADVLIPALKSSN